MNSICYLVLMEISPKVYAATLQNNISGNSREGLMTSQALVSGQHHLYDGLGFGYYNPYTNSL